MDIQLQSRDNNLHQLCVAINPAIITNNTSNTKAKTLPQDHKPHDTSQSFPWSVLWKLAFERKLLDVLYTLLINFQICHKLYMSVPFNFEISRSLNKWCVWKDSLKRQSEAMFTLIRVRVPSPGFGLRLVQASPVQVSIHGHLYKDNSTRVYRQSPVKSNRENAQRKKLQYFATLLIILLIAHPTNEQLTVR